MPRFRGTVWHTSSIVQAVQGYNPIRYVADMIAESEEDFKATIRDSYISDIDAIIEFGPISKLPEQRELPGIIVRRE